MTSKWNQKQQHFFPHPSRSHSSIRFVILCSWSEEEVSERWGPSGAHFATPWIHPLTDLAEKQQHLWGTMSTSSLPSFVKINQSVLKKKSKMLKVYAGQTDGRTSGRPTKTYENSSLEPSADCRMKKGKCNKVNLELNRE